MLSCGLWWGFRPVSKRPRGLCFELNRDELVRLRIKPPVIYDQLVPCRLKALLSPCDLSFFSKCFSYIDSISSEFIVWSNAQREVAPVTSNASGSSSAAKNFFSGVAQSITSSSHWRLSNNWNLIPSTSKNLNKFVSGGNDLFGLILAAPMSGRAGIKILNQKTFQQVVVWLPTNPAGCVCITMNHTESLRAKTSWL